MKRKTLVFLAVSAVIASAPLINWQVDDSITRGIVWRATMLLCFVLGIMLKKCDPTPRPPRQPRKRNININLTWLNE